MSFAERIKSIHYGFHAADLFEGWEQSNRYDLEASAQKYATLCKQALKEAYQEVDEIEVVFETRMLVQPTQTLLEVKVVVGVEEDGTDLLDDCTDSDEVDLITQLMSALCEEIYLYKQYKWVVKREWITILQACQRLHLPVSVIRWSCENGLIEEAEKKRNRWEFPLEVIFEFADDFLPTAVGKTIIGIKAAGSTPVFECFPEQVLDTPVLELPKKIKAWIVTPSDLGVSPLEKGGSGIVVSKRLTQTNVTFEHYGCGTSWTGERSYDVYAKALLDQAKERGIKSECEGEDPIESVRFHFSYDGFQPPTPTLREIIDWTVKRIGEIAQDAELLLSGGPQWRDAYEKDESLFCSEVLAPLLRKMGFLFVRYTHGRKEHGKDFTFSEKTKFGELRHYGLQAKAGNIRGGVRSDVDPIVKQLKKAFRMPFYEPGETNPRHISAFIVAISGRFTDIADEEIRAMMPRGKIGSVYFWDRETILSLITQYWGSG